MAKIVDFSKSVYQLSKDDPEIMEIMGELGFEGIMQPRNLQTVGRVMTIPKGAVMKGLDLEEIRQGFRRRGYEVRG